MAMMRLDHVKIVPSIISPKKKQTLLHHMKLCKVKLTRCDNIVIVKSVQPRRSARKKKEITVDTQAMTLTKVPAQSKVQNAMCELKSSSIITPTQMTNILWRALTVKGF